ncbi:MAG: 50S ribosomal protein L11 methyltransferase, partial [Chloroflexota bacterium]
MDFIEITVEHINGEAAETVCELFNRHGYGGAVVETYPPTFETSTVRTVIPSEDDHRLQQIEMMLALIGQALPGGLPQPKLQFVGKSDWANSWKEHFHTLRIGERFVIKPSWRDFTAAPDDIVIEIDPGLAFGSGLHPTTQLCLKIFETLPLADKTIFDVGTGSGVLSIAALKLGASIVRAVDVDDVAVRVADENFERNGYIPSPEANAQLTTAVGSA